MHIHRSFLFVSLALGIAAASWSGCGGEGEGGCPEESKPPCAVLCSQAGVAARLPVLCVDGQWVCDESAKEAFCSCDTTQLLVCDVCQDGHVVCEPSNACAAGCGTICQTCEMSAATQTIDGCTCSCNGGFYTCVEKCCAKDADCAAIPGAYCAEGSCVPQLEVGCWRDADCAPGEVCQGASICPCGVECFVADQPGACVMP